MLTCYVIADCFTAAILIPGFLGGTSGEMMDRRRVIKQAEDIKFLSHMS